MLQDVSDVVCYLESPGYIAEHAEFVARFTRSKAAGNMGFAVLVLVMGVGASAYGIADVFGGYLLPMGVLFLLGGPLLIVVGIVVAARSLAGYLTASRRRPASSVQDACARFYQQAFCKASGDFESKEDQVIRVCHLFPVPVLKAYEVEGGWSALAARWEQCRRDAIESAREACLERVQCVKCAKELKGLWTSGKHGMANDLSASMCDTCGATVCSGCLGHASKACPRCQSDMVGGFWNAKSLRRLVQAPEVKVKIDKDLEIRVASRERRPESVSLVIVLEACLTMKPVWREPKLGQAERPWNELPENRRSSAVFDNVAVRIGQQCFLVRMEPVVRKA